MEWSVLSRAPVQNFVLSLRKLGEEQWRVFDIPDFTRQQDRHDTYLGKYNFTGLDEASVYQVTVAARNEFGLKQAENIFTFATKGADPVHQPMIVPSSSCPTSCTPSVLATLVALQSILLPWIRLF